MKQSLILLIVALAGLFSCGDDEVLPLTQFQVTSVKAFDLGNGGNAGDIRVHFGVKDNLNVIQYRVMVIPKPLPPLPRNC